VTKKEADAVLRMTADKLVNFDLVDSALVPNLQTQRDDAIKRIGDYDANAAQVKADHDKSLKDAAEKAKADQDDLARRMFNDHAAALAAIQAQLDTVAAQHEIEKKKASDAQALVDAMGGTPLGQQLNRQAQKDELAKRIADAQSQLAKMDE